MLVSVSSACLYPLEVEKSVRVLAENNINALEIFFNAACELSGNVLKELQKTVEEYKANIVAVHPHCSPYEPYALFSDYERRFLDGMDMYKAYFDTCASIGCNKVVFHGDVVGGKLDEFEVFERYHKLYEKGKEFGVLLCYENVVKCRSREPAFFKRMKKYLGEDAAFVFDVKQARRAGFSDQEFLNAMGANLRHLHISDCNQTLDCMLPGDGKYDFSKLFQYADESCVNVDSASIEVYRSQCPDAGALYTSWNLIKNFIR